MWEENIGKYEENMSYPWLKRNFGTKFDWKGC